MTAKIVTPAAAATGGEGPGIDQPGGVITPISTAAFGRKQATRRCRWQPVGVAAARVVGRLRRAGR
jgi:hypothetical protein